MYICLAQDSRSLLTVSLWLRYTLRIYEFIRSFLLSAYLLSRHDFSTELVAWQPMRKYTRADDCQVGIVRLSHMHTPWSTKSFLTQMTVISKPVIITSHERLHLFLGLLWWDSGLWVSGSTSTILLPSPIVLLTSIVFHNKFLEAMNNCRVNMSQSVSKLMNKRLHKRWIHRRLHSVAKLGHRNHMFSCFLWSFPCEGDYDFWYEIELQTTMSWGERVFGPDDVERVNQ